MIAAHRPLHVQRSAGRRELRALPASIIVTVACVLLSLSMALAITAATRHPAGDFNAPAPGPVPQPSVAPIGLDL